MNDNQIEEEIEIIYTKSPIYTNIGHRKDEKIVLWSWNSNGLVSVETTGADGHDEYDELHDKNNACSGRFVINDKILTIYKWPKLKNRVIPDFILQELKYKFEPTRIYIFE